MRQQPAINTQPFNGPWASKEERQLTEALNSQLAPASVLRRLGPPDMLKVRRFPPRFGIGHKNAITIDDVLAVNRYYPDNKAYFSGTPGDYSGTSRYSFSNWGI